MFLDGSMIREKAADEAVVEALSSQCALPRLKARLLALRGVTPATLERYMNPSLPDLADPSGLNGVDEAVGSLLAAVRNRRRIVVFGDYDCDGVCATAIMVNALRALHADVAPFVPDRTTEGYGMNEASVARMLRDNPGVGLVVTVDNGINAVEHVAQLKERGVEVVVTDHHLPGDELPDSIVVNPKVAAPPELEWLCGSGVAFLLSMALVRAAVACGMYSGPKIGAPLIVLAGLATVTDIMPLVGQNRIIVAEALRRFRESAPVGLQELSSRAMRSAAALTARDFGFLIGPRINAAGRVASGMEALDLILETDRERARELAMNVDLRNVERKEVEQKMTDAALSQVVPGAPAQVIDIPDGHQGVSGIVAARILERLGPANAVPVCVIVRSHGSARAPEGYNVRDAFVASAEALARYGGHAAAGGFSVRDGMTRRFAELFSAACARQAALAPPGPRGATMVDAVVSGRDMTLELSEWIRLLEPFGEGNPAPLFAMRRQFLSDVRPVGQDGRHLMVAFCGAAMPRAVWWNRGDMVDALRAASAVPHDVAFTLETSSYGEPHPELRIVAMSAS